MGFGNKIPRFFHDFALILKFYDFSKPGISSVCSYPVTSCLKILHWLPIRQRIIFKTPVFVYKYLTTGQPKYFAPYLSLYKSAVNTRRSNPKNLFLQVSHYCSSIHKSKVHFNNNFSYDAPKLWNDPPHDICSAPNLSCFKSRLKPTYFRNHCHLSF